MNNRAGTQRTRESHSFIGDDLEVRKLWFPITTAHILSLEVLLS